MKQYFTLKIICISIFFTLALSGYSQADTIRLLNPSFEQKPHMGGSDQSPGIRHWFDCGIIHFVGETPPDIHPVDFWGNTKQAYDGRTYIGMVTRDNDTYESVSQKLNSKMLAGECYSFSVYLSKSERYLSRSRLHINDESKRNYTQPAVFRIWGGFGACDDKILLGETVPIDHTEWKRYDFKLKPRTDIRQITIEAFYKVPVAFPYNGHILADNLSDIIKIDCDKPELIVEVPIKKIPPHKRRKKKKKKKPKQNVEPKESKGEVAAAVQVPNLVKELDRNKIKEGQTIAIPNLYFKADTAAISYDSFEVLNEVYDFMAHHKDVKIEIGGHTNGTPNHEFCDKLSTDRARAVAEYLVKKGIEADRLTFKGYGKRKPIANNLTKSGRKKNQRVEIKITKIG